MTRSGRFMGRNPVLSKLVNKLGFFLAGLLYLANIHFSATAMQYQAQESAMATTPAVLGDYSWESLIGRYIAALGVSLVATIMLGVLLHPSGLASFVEEVRSIRGAKASKTLGAVVVTVGALLVLVVGFALYAYDFYTTLAAFGLGLRQLFTLAAVPGWILVLGPEVLFFGTNMHGYLIAGGQTQQAPQVPGSNPYGKMPTMPPAAGAMPPPNPYHIRK